MMLLMPGGSIYYMDLVGRGQHYLLHYSTAGKK